MEPSGLTRAWLRDSGGNWFDAGQVKYHEDLDRANYRFADVNGTYPFPTTVSSLASDSGHGRPQATGQQFTILIRR